MPPKTTVHTRPYTKASAGRAPHPPPQFPLVRHLYYWWGFRPITKRCMRHLLAAGRSVVLVPGGVQECLVMEHEGVEVAYLR